MKYDGVKYICFLKCSVMLCSKSEQSKHIRQKQQILKFEKMKNEFLIKSMTTSVHTCSKRRVRPDFEGQLVLFLAVPVCWSPVCLHHQASSETA